MRFIVKIFTHTFTLVQELKWSLNGVTIYARTSGKLQILLNSTTGENPAAGGNTREPGPVRSRPKIFDTNKSSASSAMRLQSNNILFGTWSFTVAVGAINRTISDEVRRGEENVTQDNNYSHLSNEQKEISKQLRTLLVFLCEEEAAASVRSAEDGDGLHARQALLGPKSLRNPTSLMNQLLATRVPSSDPRVNLRTWRETATDCQAETVEILSEQIRKTIHFDR